MIASGSLKEPAVRGSILPVLRRWAAVVAGSSYDVNVRIVGRAPDGARLLSGALWSRESGHHR